VVRQHGCISVDIAAMQCDVHAHASQRQPSVSKSLGKPAV
jgi:hypothetical protein